MSKIKLIENILKLRMYDMCNNPTFFFILLYSKIFKWGGIMLLLYIKFTIIIIFVAIIFKLLTKIVTFNTSHYYIKNQVKSEKISLIITAILLVISIDMLNIIL